MASATPTTESAPTTSRLSRFPIPKITAFTRLKSYGETFVQSHKSPPPVVFPPPSWDLDDETMGAGQSKTPPVVESSNPIPVMESPEPISFANRLKSMIEALPILTRPSTPNPSGGLPAPIAKAESERPSPVPSNLDDGLVRMLSSEDVMNGNRATPPGQGDKQTSIWNILAGLRKGEGKEEVGQSSTPAIVEEEEGGLMMYAPLEPKNDSEVELAKSETILEPAEDSKTHSESDKVEVPTGPAEPVANNPPSEIIEKHIWVPSTTDISVLTTWWGYRIYLPPPVMAKLDGKSVKATARAAMITTALKWMLDKVPMAIVPPQFRPAVMMLKKLSPLTGYIGVFIAWSWDRVRSIDTGNGVVLSATWLLPVALLPMSWDAGDIYRPIAPPKPEELVAMEQAAAKAAEEERKKAAKNGSSGQGNQKEERKKSFFRW